ncbi:MAG TPA: hypothetical protein VFP84_25285 [Kofleriaceae bacterium]|nr:hypothetical protein [Kofleriaceae bacterium]
MTGNRGKPPIDASTRIAVGLLRGRAWRVSSSAPKRRPAPRAPRRRARAMTKHYADMQESAAAAMLCVPIMISVSRRPENAAGARLRKTGIAIDSDLAQESGTVIRAAQLVGLGMLFGLGAVLGLVLAVLIIPISFARAARAVHADGVVCRASIEALDARADRLAGPALVRLSGALEGAAGTSDILGMAIRLQRAASDDVRVGDQDLLLGSFRSFATASADRAATRAGDFVANTYHFVTPWWLPGRGIVSLALIPPPLDALPAARGADRLARLDADLAAQRAVFTLSDAGAPIARLRLVERLAVDGAALRASLLRQGRGVRPLGLRNGVRVTLYPLSQAARRLRGG